MIRRKPASGVIRAGPVFREDHANLQAKNERRL
jgi:hypothetical protein